MNTEQQRQLDELDELERLEEEQADRDYAEQRRDSLGPCGCSDYHYADCPIRSGS